MIAVYQFLENLAVPAAIAWAIVALTIVVRAVLIPLYRASSCRSAGCSSSSPSCARSRSATRATR